jgi:hypothetical protein
MPTNYATSYAGMWSMTFLDGPQAAGLAASELEDQLARDGRELMLRLMQDHLDLRATREPRLAQVTDADTAPRGAVEKGHTRALHTVFGEVDVTRRAYRSRGCRTCTRPTRH